MSARAVIWARDQRLPTSQKVLLLVLASHLNPKDGRCFPSQETLAWETGLSRRGVQVAAKALVKSKHISVGKERKSGQWAGSIYRIHMPEQSGTKSGHHAQEVRLDRGSETAHGEKNHHAQEVRTKGCIYTGDKTLAKNYETPALRIVSGGAA